MKTATIVALAVVAVLVCGIGGCGLYTMGTYNSLVRQENGIEAVHEDMKNVHASIFNQIKSQGLTVEKYGDLVIQALEVSMSGRYGKTGSQAAMQWLKEENPTISPDVFTKLQTVIEVGYNKFESTQRSKIDRIRVYENSLEQFPSSLIASSFGFPRFDLAMYKVTISSAKTKKTFETGEMETIDPFANE
ncbi:hypothetical protein ACFL2U_02335 [Patescibacteria group bacterium]